MKLEMLLVLALWVMGQNFISAVTTEKQIDGSIIFPDSVEQLYNQDYDKDVPQSCKGQTYCTMKTDDYPEKKFNDMFKGYKAFPQPTLVLNPLQNRVGELNDCKTELTFEPLYKVRENKNKPWRYVVQAPDHDYVQKMRLEKCLNTEASCFTKFTLFPGFKTYCEQKYSIWEVVVAKGDNGTEVIKAELPVCCTCNYSKTSFIPSKLGQTTRK